MSTRPIPSSGELLPVIGMGTWKTFDVASASRSPLQDVLSTFTQLGGTLVDSSPMYGRAEVVVGDLAKRTGVLDQLFVATRVWTSGRDAGIAQMEESERRLGGRVDLMQVHNLIDADTHLATLREWKASGRIRYIGVTHYTSSAFGELEKWIERGGIDFVQLNYSAGEREAERRLLPLASERGIAVLVNRPLGTGDLLRKTAGKQLPSFAAALGCETWAELLLKFVVSHPAVTCVIPATSSVEHLRENMRAGEGAMPDEEMRAQIAKSVP